jgi:hypothetical protein
MHRAAAVAVDEVEVEVIVGLEGTTVPITTRLRRRTRSWRTTTTPCFILQNRKSRISGQL